MFAIIRMWWRLARLGIHLMSGCIQLAFMSPWGHSAFKQRQIQSWSAKLLQLCGIQLALVGQPYVGQAKQGQFWVSNHISWMDIFVINSIRPTRFVAKADIRSWFLIGWLVAQADTVFIQRHQRQHTNQALNNIEQVLQQGGTIGLFPEGTSTDGTAVKPFKASLFQAAINQRAIIQPLAIEYLTEQGEHNTAPAYCDDITLWQCLQQVLLQPQSTVRVHCLPCIASDAHTRQQLAPHVQRSIATIIQTANSPQYQPDWNAESEPIYMNETL